MISTRQIFMVICILLLLIVSIMHSIRPIESIHLDRKQLESAPDYYIDNLKVIQFNADGRWINRLKANKLLHFIKHDSHVFINPVMRSNKEHTTFWRIQAKTAVAINHFEQISFEKAVRIIQNNQQDHSTIHTTQLTYYPKTQIATTAAPIHIKDNKLQLDAIGMNANLSTQHIVFMQQTKAIL